VGDGEGAKAVTVRQCKGIRTRQRGVGIGDGDIPSSVSMLCSLTHDG